MGNDATMLMMGGKPAGFIEAGAGYSVPGNVDVADNPIHPEHFTILPQDSVLLKPAVSPAVILNTPLALPDSMRQVVFLRHDTLHRRAKILPAPAKPDSILIQGLKENPPPYFVAPGKQTIQDFFYPGKISFAGKQAVPGEMRVFTETRPDSAATGAITDLGSTPLHTSYTPDWIAGILLTCLLLLSWIRIFFGKYFRQTLQGLVNFQISVKLFNDRNLLLQRVFTLLNLNFLLIGALFTYLAFDHFKINFLHYSPFINYLLIIAGIFGLLSLKYLSTAGLNWLFPKRTLLQEYFYQVQQFYKSLGLILLPLVVVIAYFNTPIGKNFIWPGIVVVIMLFMYRIFRGYKIIIHKDIKLFYLILYFCALEILPILVLCKFVAQLA